MTRLTNTTYLIQHHQLKDEWFSESGGAFIILSANEQWYLNAYFEFTKKLSDYELLAHRQSITDRSLPQRAGRAFAKLAMFTDRLVEYRIAQAHAPRPRKGRAKQITVFSEVHPDIDVAKLIDALNDYRRSRP